MTVRILRINIKLIKIKATLHLITIRYITFFCYSRLAFAQEQRSSQTKSWRSLFVGKVPRMCYCYVIGSICCPLAEKLCGPLHLLFVWKNIRNEYWTWSGSSSWRKTSQPHFLFLSQLFPFNASISSQSWTCISSGSPSYFRAAHRRIDQTIGRLVLWSNRLQESRTITKVHFLVTWSRCNAKLTPLSPTR